MSYTELMWIWENFSGGPGYSRFRFNGSLTGADVNSAAANVKTLFEVFKTWIPSGATVRCDPSARIYDELQTLLDEDPIGTLPATVAGQQVSAYAGGVGAVVYWNTSSIWNGTKVRGRTYFVPLGGCYETNGSLSSSAVGTMRTAATAFATSTPTPVVNAVRRNDAGEITAGNTSTMSSATVPDRSAQLRSRRG